MPLSKIALKKLKALAHHLNPVIITGNKGLTEQVCLETSRALDVHELIKVRINALDKEEKMAMIQQLCDFCQAELVSVIGHIAIVYRENPELQAFTAHFKK